ncbi:MAG: glycoside hydrolase family 125 protein [Bacillus subtilis]|nr:glycoside hydrolase family 125 protein [Bacillus subtilis]
MKRSLVLVLISLLGLGLAACNLSSTTTTSSAGTTSTLTLSSSSGSTTPTTTTTISTTPSTSQSTTPTTTQTSTTPSTTANTTTTLAVVGIQNGGFESGTLLGWTEVEGSVFSQALTNQTAVDGVPYGKSGSYLLGRTADAGTGKLRSSTFDIAGSGFITFRLGGSYNAALTYLSVVDANTGQELARYGNPRFNNVSYQTDPINHRVANLIPYRADLSAHLGKQAYLLLVDDSTANFGYVTFDDVVSYYPSLSGVPSATTLAVDIKPVVPALATIPYQLANGDFMSRTLDSWNVIGEPNSFLSAHINAQYRLSNRPNESSVGVLRSSFFRVGGIGLVSFRIGATKHADLTYVVIKRAGTNEELFRTYSDRWRDAHEENTHLYYVDLSNYMDEVLYFEFVDNSRGDWGLITIEQIQTLYPTMPYVRDEIAVNLNLPKTNNPTYSVMRGIIDGLIDTMAGSTLEKTTFEKTFYATLDGIQNNKGNFPSVLHYKPNGMTFIYTGDIPAMWLRDSSAQVLPYLQFMTIDEDVRLMVRGLLSQQFEQIRRDPYANAFNEDGSVFERKFEIDSLCYPIWLAVEYYANHRRRFDLRSHSSF